jgi:indole-3-glycerol phosphate synthase
VLVILAAFDKYKAQEILFEVGEWGLDALVEVHNEDEIAIAKKLGAKFIGINNRNLNTLEVDLGMTERLAPLMPEGTVLVAESGLESPEHLARMHTAGVHQFLVGTSLLTQGDVAAATRALLAPAAAA